MIVNDPIYFSIFEYGKTILNRLDATCERARMENPREKYYTKIYENLVDYNDRNDAPLSNDDVIQAIHKIIAEEEAGAHNITADTFSQTPVTPNTQGENENTILTS